MRISSAKFALALFCAAVHGAAVAESASPLLVDVDWLSSRLNDRDLVVLHVGSKTEFEAGHIQGARFISLADIALPMDPNRADALMLELPSAEKLRATLEEFGVSDNSRIVVTYDTHGPFQSATRVAFTLDYLGLGDRTSVLNGGMVAWTAAGKAVTQALPSIQPGKLSVRPTKAIVADAAFVQSIAQHPHYKLVDARAPVFFNGGDASFGQKGHIPGAVSIPFSEITGTNMAVDRNHIAQVFQQAGIQAGDTIVAYCHVGQQATAVVLAARILGYPVLLYDGSFQDWVVNKRGTLQP